MGGAVLVLVSVVLLRVGADAIPSWMAGGLVCGQIAGIVWLFARRAAVLYRVMLAAAAAGLVAWGLVYAGLTAGSVALGVGGFCHCVAYGSLLVWFFRSLQAGREPVVTGFARQIRQTMPAAVVRYTRQVTIAWVIFFAAQLVVSAGLLIAAPLWVWSLFVNRLNFALIVGMMLAEFGVRLVLFRHETPTGLLATLAGLRRVRGLPGGSS